MTRALSDQVRDHFAAGTRDLTPTSARHAACVLYAPVSSDSDVSENCASVLSAAELHRADRFARESDQAHFKQRRAFRRYCAATMLGSSRPLSKILFDETENGRPYLSDLPDVWFSFASCRFGFLGAWSTTHGIGVDLEDHSINLEVVKLADRYYSGAEASAVEGLEGPDRRQAFFQFWSLKEAALKSIGEGLPFGLDAFEFELDPNLRVVHAPPDHGGPEQFGAHVIEGTDGCAALVIRSLA